MKKIVLLTAIFMMLLFNSQNVGINTTTPQVTLDIVGKPDVTTKPDGVIPPRITREQLIAKSASYGPNQTGAVIYVTDLSGVTNTETANITSVGYYYFDGNKWASLTGPLFASVIKSSDTVYQNPNTINTGNTYAAANNTSVRNNCVVKLMDGTIIQNGVTVNTSTDNIIIPSDGMYEIDFIATISDNGSTATTFRMYIGDTINSLIGNWFLIPSAYAQTVPIKYVGFLTAGTKIDFRISTDGGQSGQLRQFSIMAKKL